MSRSGLRFDARKLAASAPGGSRGSDGSIAARLDLGTSTSCHVKVAKIEPMARPIRLLPLLLVLLISPLSADEMENPEGLVTGGGFRDRILPMPIHDGLESDGLWGARGVIPRDVHNGIEHPEWSYWGGNPLLGEDGKYHMNICRWPESAERGHMSWQESTMVHTVADKPTGPYRPTAERLYEHRDGKGHNPETIRLADGRYMLHLWSGYVYLADAITGPWKYEGKVEIDTSGVDLDKSQIRILNRNMTAVVRDDGSILIVTKRGHVMISDGNPLGPYKVVNTFIYPQQYQDEGPEDPVIWRGPAQWHLLYNRWKVRKAVYMRSPDGIHWKHDPGIAYDPYVTRYEDGTKTEWYKLERPHVLQDEHGRATHLSLAVIDVVKRQDLANDNHGSKNIILPLVTPRLLEIVPHAEKLLVKIKAEPGFDPWRDIDVDSLRYGASEEVNFGRGAPALASKRDGKDRVIEFDRGRTGFTGENFAGKLIGRTTSGDLLLGWSRDIVSR